MSYFGDWICLCSTISMCVFMQDVMIVLRGSIPISLGGSQEPAAFGELVSIGGLSPEVNKNLSAAIAEILETKLCIPKSRIFLKFYDSQASHLNF
jgi:phenylpyruvate tautomerase